VAIAVKICGITNRDDALHAARCGAHAIGLVFHPSSPRYVNIDDARKIVAVLPPFISAIGLFVDAEADAVREVMAAVRLSALQFHGDEAATYCEQFNVPYLKAVRVKAEMDLLQWAEHYPSAQGLLLDSYVADQNGGTGVSFDWALIPPGLTRPVILAGGLTPENVEVAVRRVRPWAVDVSSGVEKSKGSKDADKVAAFIRGARNADV
jgi:phosphoribosylanthranilate isomerase